MSELDVHRVMCPITEQRLKHTEEQLEGAKLIILALRRRLIATGSNYPTEYDGTAWAKYEAITHSPSGASATT